MTKLRYYVYSSLEILLISFLLLFSSLLVLNPSNPMKSNLSTDSGAFAYFGNQIRHGAIPYVDVWDSKPPGVFLVDALGLSLISGSLWGVWLIEYLSLILSTFLIFIAMRKKYGLGSALFSTFIWHSALFNTLQGGNLTEEYSLLFGFLSVSTFIYWSINRLKTIWFDVLIGLSLGCSFLFRLNNTGPEVVIIFVFIIVFLEQKKYKELFLKLVMIGVSVLIPLLALAIYLIPLHVFGAFWEASITYNLAYSGSKFNPASALLAGLSYIGFTGGVAALGVIGAFQTTIHEWKKNNGFESITLWILLSAIIEVVLSGISGRNYLHYFINWAPLIAVASASFISKYFEILLNIIQKRTILFLGTSAVLLVSFFYNVPFGFIHDILPLLTHSGTTQKDDSTAVYIRRDTEKNQTVLVWGGRAGINFLASRKSPTPYLFYPLYVPSEITDRMSKSYYEDLISSPPSYIVEYPIVALIPLDTPDPESWLKQNNIYATPYLLDVLSFIQKNYYLKIIIKNVNLYKLRLP